MVNTNPVRSTHLKELLEKSRPRLEPAAEEAERSLKDSRPAIGTPMLDLVFRDGQIRSFNYAYLAGVDFKPGDSLTLKFSNGATVLVEGRGLLRHRMQVRQHRAEAIQESTQSELALDTEGISQVERIYITEGSE